MRAADEVAFVDTVNGTNLNAGATACAKIVVDARKIILYGDCAVRTGFLTLHTADTTVGAILTGKSALILVGAFNNHACGIVDKVDDSVGTLAYTYAASNTLLGIDTGNAVLNRNSVLRTYSRTVTVAEAGEGAVLIAAVSHICGEAGLVTLIVALSGSCITGAVAGNVSNLFNNVLGFYAKNGSDRLCGTVTAGNTKIGFIGGFVCESLCIAVTARVSASTAVSTGQTVTDSNRGLVLFYSKEYARNGEKHRANNSNSE